VAGEVVVKQIVYGTIGVLVMAWSSLFINQGPKSA